MRKHILLELVSRPLTMIKHEHISVVLGSGNSIFHKMYSEIICVLLYFTLDITANAEYVRSELE